VNPGACSIPMPVSFSLHGGEREREKSGVFASGLTVSPRNLACLLTVRYSIYQREMIRYVGVASSIHSFIRHPNSV